MLYAGFEYIYMRGAPADRINNADVTLKGIAIWFEWMSVAAAAWFIYLGSIASRTQVKGRFWLGAVLYTIATVVLIFIGAISTADLLC